MITNEEFIITTKKQLIQYAKQQKMMKTFIITIHVLYNRKYEKTIQEIIDKIITIHNTTTKFNFWIEEWKEYINKLIIKEHYNITQIMTNKSI